MQTKVDTDNLTRLAAFSAFISLFLVLFGPLDIFVHNSDEFSSTPAELVSILLLMAGALFALVFTVLFLSPRVVKNAVFKGLAFLVLGSWVISNFLYGEYGRLDGKELVINTWSSLAFVQTAVLLLLLFLIVKLEIDNVFKLTGVVFLMGLLSSAIGIMSLETKDSQIPAADFPSTLTQFSPSKNVLHIVLDELGSDIFIHVVESDDRLKQALDGFTIFSDALSVYPSTEMSILVLMTGEVYRNNGPKRAFIKKVRKQNKGIKRLESLGYELDAHTRCQLGALRRCTLINSRILNEDLADIEALQLLDIFIFKSVPDYLKPDVYNNEKWLFLAMSNHNSYLKFQSGVAHLLFKKFVEDISVSDSSSPRYKFFHSMVTHAPSDLDADCDIVDEDQASGVTKTEFVKCGLGQFSDLLEKLKELDIYDQTMIVLSSDHGDYWIDDSVDVGKFKSRGIRIGMFTRASAALAIKPFDARGPVAMTQAPVSLRDIPQTILAANGLDQDTSVDTSSATRDVFSVNPNEDREREFLFYVWEHKYWAEEVLPPITTIKINGRRKDPQAWSIPASAVRSTE